MAGQPVSFDVSNLTVVSEQPAGAMTPTTIIDQGRTFVLGVQFGLAPAATPGETNTWQNLIVNAGIYQFRVRYFIHSLTGTLDSQLGATSWQNLAAGVFSYNQSSTPNTTITVTNGTIPGPPAVSLTDGVYRIVAVVDFRSSAAGNPPLFGWLGYAETLIQINPSAHAG